VLSVVLCKHLAYPTIGVSGFKTDTDISGGVVGRQRELQQWEGSAETGVDLSLDDHGGKPWDQFEANERLYGLRTNYDESFYTTTIDKSHPEYKEREAKAERLAREIEGTSSMNAHVAEERGQKAADDSGLDEEAKYSGVTRSFPPLPTGQTNKYTPPARRPPTGQSTVPGAPVDDAIIYSSLARPGAKDKAPSPVPGSAESQSQSQSKPDSQTHVDETQKPAEISSKSEEAEGKTESTGSSSSSSSSSKPTIAPAKLSPVKPTSGVSPSRQQPKEGGAAATVERDVVNAFKQFTANEKLRAQEVQRNNVKRDKAVKLNDLKKFAQNFKLNTPVPTDLVPILAKDKDKQEKIVEKALRTVQELKSTPPKPAPASLATTASAPSEAKPSKATTPRDSTHTSPIPAAAEQRPSQPRNQRQPSYPQNLRQTNPPAQQVANPQMPPRNGPSHGNLGQRLHMNHHQYNRAGGHPQQYPMPIDPRIPPTGPAAAAASNAQSPTSGLRYSAKTFEFRPGTTPFQPSAYTSTGSSPVRDPSVKATPRPTRANLIQDRSAASKERPDVNQTFLPLERAKKEAQDEGKEKDYVPNGGIPQAYRTGPTWDVSGSNKDRAYAEVFDKAPTNLPIVGSHGNMVHHQPMPHQHQLPHHLQQGGAMGQGHTPHHTPRHMPVQPHVGPNGQHYDDHRMQYSASTSSIMPSPRAVPQYMAYNNQGGQPVPMYQQAMPGYGMAPQGGHPMTMRQVSSGHQFMAPQGPGMGGPGMANSPGAHYMNMQMNSQVPMFPPGPGQVYPPHNAGMQPQPGAGGYPSPRPPAQMMVPQGSQQSHHHLAQPVYNPGQHGQHGPVYGQPPTGPSKLLNMEKTSSTMTRKADLPPVGPMRGPYGAPHQPHYGTSPHQPHHFPQPHRSTPSATYVQPMMNHSMPPQTVPPATGAPLSSDPPEDVK
jgi:hypothetical protein